MKQVKPPKGEYLYNTKGVSVLSKLEHLFLVSGIVFFCINSAPFIAKVWMMFMMSMVGSG